MKIIDKKILAKITGKKTLQTIMYKLYLLGLTGMNYGNANTFTLDDSGEKDVLKYVNRLLRKQGDFVLFDVGANIGDYSKLASQIFNKTNLKICAFEPISYTFSLLTNNTNDIKIIRCFNFGLGAKKETLPIYSNYETSGATTLYKNALDNYSFNKQLVEEIEIKTLDDVCNKEAIDSIDFLKIDVEGHELSVLSGANKLLEKGSIKFIQFEFGPFNVYSRTYFRDFWNLLNNNYIIYRILTKGLFKIKKYDENLEIFKTANFLAQLKTL